EPVGRVVYVERGRRGALQQLLSEVPEAVVETPRSHERVEAVLPSRVAVLAPRARVDEGLRREDVHLRQPEQVTEQKRGVAAGGVAERNRPNGATVVDQL